jgi:hypothetical protein
MTDNGRQVADLVAERLRAWGSTASSATPATASTP